MLTLRPAEPHDLPPLAALLMDNTDKYLDDYEPPLSLEALAALIQLDELLVVDDNGYAAGVFWFYDRLDDLHCKVSFLVRPEYYRQVKRQKLIHQAFTWAFDRWKLGKIKALPMSTQKGAIKLLREHSFFEHRPLFKETRQKGVKVDVIPFELRRRKWEQFVNG